MANRMTILALGFALVSAGACTRVAGDTSTTSRPAVVKFRTVPIPASTILVVRVATPLRSETNHVEDQVLAELANDVQVNGIVALPAGAQLTGVVTRAIPSGKVKGRAELAFQCDRIRVGSSEYPIHATYTRIAPATTGDDAKKIGVPAGKEVSIPAGTVLHLTAGKDIAARVPIR